MSERKLVKIRCGPKARGAIRPGSLRHLLVEHMAVGPAAFWELVAVSERSKNQVWDTLNRARRVGLCVRHAPGWWRLTRHGADTLQRMEEP